MDIHCFYLPSTHLPFSGYSTPIFGGKVGSTHHSDSLSPYGSDRIGPILQIQAWACDPGLANGYISSSSGTVTGSGDPVRLSSRS